MPQNYVHDEDLHNLDAPREITPKLLEWFTPRSVLDIGCGIGTFLHCCKENGVEEVLGIDGDWVKQGQISKYLDSHEFLETDLATPLSLNRQYDMVLCLEVAEHLPRESADILVENLVSAGKVIIFSAAIPGQGGQNHINEQWPNYWQEKFAQHDYEMHDVLKHHFWNNPNIFWWYKQNMLIYTPKGYTLPNELSSKNILKGVVHPEQFSYMQYRLEQAEKNSRLL